MRNVIPTRPEPADRMPESAATSQVSTPHGPPNETTARTESPVRRNRRTTTYDRTTRSAGLLVGVLLMAVIWITGGYFTLAWLKSIGIVPAASGMALVDWVIGRRTTLDSHWITILGAWSIPAAVSLIEVGLWPRRTPHLFTILLFLTVLAFSAYTTAAGLVLFLKTDPLTAWAIAGLLGIVLDLVPEKGMRVLWRLLREV